MNHKIYTPVFLALSILIGLFWLKPVYEASMDKSTQINTIQKDLLKSDAKLAELQKLKASFSSGSTSTISAQVKKMATKWDTGHVMSTIMLSDFTKPDGLLPARIAIGSISVNPWTVLPSGISLGSANFSVRATNLESLLWFLTYLTKNADMVFVIDSISLPLDTSDRSRENDEISLSLQLGVYYYAP